MENKRYKVFLSRRDDDYGFKMVLTDDQINLLKYLVDEAVICYDDWTYEVIRDESEWAVI